jgi:hypothetical protein
MGQNDKSPIPYGILTRFAAMGLWSVFLPKTSKTSRSLPGRPPDWVFDRSVMEGDGGLPVVGLSNSQLELDLESAIGTRLDSSLIFFREIVRLRKQNCTTISFQLKHT